MWLIKKYGEHVEVTATRGKVHEYLGMKFIFDNRKFKVDITEKFILSLFSRRRVC